MPTINEIIASLKDAQSRASINEIDLLDMADITEEQQRILINLLIAFSQYRRPRFQEDTEAPKNPHQVKILKLKNFLITYAEMLEIINSGLKNFWLLNCKISLKENLTGRYVLEKFSLNTMQIEKTFDENAIYVPILRQDNEMQHLKLEECTKLPDNYLIYLRFHLMLVETRGVAVTDEKKMSSETAALKILDEKTHKKSNLSAKRLIRQQKRRTLPKIFITSSLNSSTASTSYSASTDTPLTEPSSAPASPKSFSWNSSSSLTDDYPGDTPQNSPPTSRL